MSHSERSAEDQFARLCELQAGLYRKRLAELASVYGSVRAVGKALNIDHAYLQRLASGEKRNPSKATLRKLGLAI